MYVSETNVRVRMILGLLIGFVHSRKQSFKYSVHIIVKCAPTLNLAHQLYTSVCFMAGVYLLFQRKLHVTHEKSCI